MIAKTERDKNRERMPNVADVIDQFNAFFGPARVTAAEDFETGAKVGTFSVEISDEEKTFSK